MAEHIEHAAHAHAAPTGFIRKYVFSLDHKVIGIQYYFLALASVFIGMFLSLLMRIHLVWPGVSLPLIGEIKPETYLSLLTMHGTFMVFFVLTTAPQSGFGNYFLPIQIGATFMMAGLRPLMRRTSGEIARPLTCKSSSIWSIDDCPRNFAPSSAASTLTASVPSSSGLRRNSTAP